MSRSEAKRQRAAAPQTQTTQLQRSADAVARAISGECPKLTPADRKELIVQTHRWLGERIKSFDQAELENRDRIKAPTATETQIALGAFGKGCRTADTMAV